MKEVVFVGFRHLNFIDLNSKNGTIKVGFINHFICDFNDQIKELHHEIRLRILK